MELLEKEQPNPDLERESIESVHEEVSREYPDSNIKIFVYLGLESVSVPALAEEDDDFSDLSEENRELFKTLNEHTDPAEFEADEAIEPQSDLPQNIVYAHELGHKYFGEFADFDSNTDPLVRNSLSEMFAEATAYHFTDHDPEDAVLERNPFSNFSGFGALKLLRMSEPYEEMKDGQYDGPIDVPHGVECRLGAMFAENDNHPSTILDNIAEYGKAMKDAIKLTLDYAQQTSSPEIEDLDREYQELLEEVT
jgi:hypothetical protein